jgi:thiamine kinase-like enzyme
MNLFEKIKSVLAERFSCLRPEYRRLLEQGELYVIHNRLDEAKICLLRSVKINDELFSNPNKEGDFGRLQLAQALLAYVFVLEKDYDGARKMLSYCEGASDAVAKTQYYVSKALYHLRDYNDEELFAQNLNRAKLSCYDVKDKSESQRLERLVTRMSSLLPSQKLSDS